MRKPYALVSGITKKRLQLIDGRSENCIFSCFEKMILYLFLTTSLTGLIYFLIFVVVFCVD